MSSCAERASRGECRVDPDAFTQCREACYNHMVNLRHARQLLGITDRGQVPASTHVLVDALMAGLSNIIFATYRSVFCCAAYDAYDALLHRLHDGTALDVHPEALEMALELDAAAKLIFTDAALGDDWLEARKSHLQGTWIAQQEASRETAASPLQATRLHVLATLVVSLALITAPLLISAWHLWRGSGAPRPELEPAGKQAVSRKES